ncbi:MAG: hypothetical protein Q4E47_01305 [Candidatus Saccharibacteria bacterium]|nr:hypothetical protein [Candidatus Saccharibacteria bacterium]
MGRYYSTFARKRGKFGYSQPSDDPKKFFKSDECDRDEYRVYFISDYEKVKKKIDECYDILGIPEDERIYEAEFTDEGCLDIDYEWLDSYTFDSVKRYSKKTKFIEISYITAKKGELGVPKSDQHILARDRIILGLILLADISEDGYCLLMAEQ